MGYGVGANGQEDIRNEKPYIMRGAMASFDDILRCVEKWRLYNEQTTKQ